MFYKILVIYQYFNQGIIEFIINDCDLDIVVEWWKVFIWVDWKIIVIKLI